MNDDFLSKFNKENYVEGQAPKGKKEQKESRKPAMKAKHGGPSRLDEQKRASIQAQSHLDEQKRASEEARSDLEQSESVPAVPAETIEEEMVPVTPEPLEKKEKPAMPKPEKSRSIYRKEQLAERHREREEETEFDPSFKGKRIRKYGIMAVIAVAVLVLGFFIHYQLTHVTLPNFVSDEVSEARTWMTDNGMILDTKQEYSTNAEVNTVLAQKQKAGKKVKKGTTVQLTVCVGADPNEVLELPDFMTMTKTQAEEWKNLHKAENLSIAEEYSETIDSGKAVKIEFNNKDVTAETYQRKEKATVFYSKGEEVLEKNITVPEFVGKSKDEAQTWGKTNSVTINVEEQTSDKVEAGVVISQSVAKDEKVAKKDEMKIVASLGKGMIVPNFGDLTPETAAGAVDGLNIQVSSVFSESVPYGRMISQSVEAGKELTSKDSLSVKVSYSLGRPYMKDIRGSMTEGDLPQYFFDEYQAKGANITYQTAYVDSSETKGLVVLTSVVNEYLPMEHKVVIGISRGNLVAQEAME